MRFGQTWRAGRLGRHDEPRRRPAHCPVRRCGRVQPGIYGRAAGATTRAKLPHPLRPPLRCRQRRIQGLESSLPLNMQDPQGLMSALSPDELSCVLQNADPQVLLKLMGAPDTATPEEAEGFITCLENETLLTFFLVPFTSQTGALSEETSACLRGGFEGIDLRAMMLGSFAGPDDEAAMISGMTGFILTLSCLNEEEWETCQPGAGTWARTTRMACNACWTKVGGPEGLAAMSSPDAGPPIALFGAALECNLAFIQPPPS